MMTLGPLAFAAPWALGALLVLPVIWWLLRVVPPAAVTVRFPAVDVVRDLVAERTVAARTPWWVLLLRLLLAAFLILALARPLFAPGAALPGSGPVILVLDDGWASGRDWTARREAALGILSRAGAAGRTAVLVPTSQPDATVEGAPAQMAETLAAWTPKPWPVDRAAAAARLEALGPGHVVWVSDGIAAEGDAALATAMARMGTREILRPGVTAPALAAPRSEPAGFAVEIRRAEPGPATPVAVRAEAADGRFLGRSQILFPDGARSASGVLELPVELRNAAAVVRLEDEPTAGAVALLDERWRRRTVGLVSGRPPGEQQPILTDLHYLERALAPHADVRRGQIRDLLARGLSVLVLSDVGALAGEEVARIGAWVEAGGVLVRYAGPRLAGGADTLLPVTLRGGERRLGGALAWEKPARLQPFAPGSPFEGLPVPAEVTVSRQVLAEPGASSTVWARLEDGTPLVTAATRGKGLLVLVHTTAGPDWSTLALSGLNVGMLRRFVALAEGSAGPQPTGGAPLETLDGFGRLGPPPATAVALETDSRPSPRTPPGFYGQGEQRRAFNLFATAPDLVAVTVPPDTRVSGYGGPQPRDLTGLVLLAALVLFLLDLVVAMTLRARRFAPALGLLLALLAPVAEARDPRAELSGEVGLAYVVTGDAEADAVARAGLEGVGRNLERRTAVEIGRVEGVDPDRDELGWYPLLVWVMPSSPVPPTPKAAERLNAFLRTGGTIFVDTRGNDDPRALRTLLAGVDVPPLAPVEQGHVLGKAFFLMREFTGRAGVAEVWAAVGSEANDGVSPIVVGKGDFVGAWAVDRGGRPLLPVSTGNERQRELANRFGVNLVLYALTGNYKLDQVHVPAILERIGR